MHSEEEKGCFCRQAIRWNTHVVHDKSILKIISPSSKSFSCFIGDLLHYVLNLGNRRRRCESLEHLHLKGGFCNKVKKCLVPLLGVKGGCELDALCGSQTDLGNSRIHPQPPPAMVLSVSSYGHH